MSEPCTKGEHKRWGRGKRILAGCSLLIFVVVILLLARDVFKSPDSPSQGGENNIAQKPAQGDPSMYSPEQNLAIAMGVTEKLEGYTSKTTGSVIAQMGFINYEQTVNNKRVVDGSKIFVEAVSRSSLKKVGEQKYFTDDGILVRKAVKINDDSVEWAQDVYRISDEDYLEAYGTTPRNLCAYVVNQNTILSAERLDAADGNYAFKYTLKAQEAAAYYCREVKTMGGASDYPVFHEIEFVLTMDEQWRPLKIERTENYDISIPLIGSANCTASLTEVFYDFSQQGNMPNEDIGDIVDPPVRGEDEILEILRGMFKKQPTYAVDISGDVNGKLYVNIDLKEKPCFKIKGSIGDVPVFAAYSGGKLYLHLGQARISMSERSLADATQTVCKALGYQMPALDENVINDIIQNLTVSQQDSKMLLSIKSEAFSVDASLNTEDGIALQSAEAGIKSGGAALKVKVKPSDYSSFEALEGYNDISGVTSLLPGYLKLAEAKSVSLDISLGAGVNTYKASAVLALNGTAQARLSTLVEGTSLTATLKDGAVYVSYGAVNVKCALVDMERVLDEILKLVPGDTSFIPDYYAEFFNSLTLKDAALALKDIRFSANALSVTVQIGKSRINARVYNNSLDVTGIEINGTELGVSMRITGISDKAPVFSCDEEYVDLGQAVSLLPTLKELMEAKSISFDVKLGYGKHEYNAQAQLAMGQKVSARLTTAVSGRNLIVTYKDETVYVSYGNIHIKCAAADMEQVLADILALVPSDTELLPEAYAEFFNGLSLKSAVSAVEKLSYTDSLLTLRVKIGDADITACITKESVSITGIELGGRSVHAVLTLTGTGSTAPEFDCAGDYADANKLTPLFGAAVEMSGYKSFSVAFSCQVVRDDTLRFTAEADVLFKLKSGGLDAKVYLAVDGESRHKIDFVYKDGRFACDYNGMRLTIGADQLVPILSSIKNLMGVDIPLLDRLLPVAPEDRIDLSMLKPYLPDMSFVSNAGSIDVLAAINGISAADDSVSVRLNGEMLTGVRGAQEAVITVRHSGGLITQVNIDNIASAENETLCMRFGITALEDCTVSLPTDLDGYMNLDSINKLINEFGKTANLGQYRVTGKLKASMLSIFSADIPFDCRVTVDESNNVRGYIKLNIPYVLGVTNNNTTTEIYIENSVMYVKRYMKKLTVFGKDKTDYVKFTLGSFIEDPMENVFHMFNMTSAIQKTIRSSMAESSGNAQGALLIEKVIRDYKLENGETYKLVLDGAYLAGDNNFSDITLRISPDLQGFLSTIKVDTKIISILSLELNGTLADAGEPVDMSPIPSGLESNSSYVWK